MVNKDLATLAGEVQLVALEKGFLQQWERGPFFGAEYKNRETGLSVYLETAAEGKRNLHVSLSMRKEIRGDSLHEVQGCVDTFRKASDHLKQGCIYGTFRLADDALDCVSDFVWEPLQPGNPSVSNAIQRMLGYFVDVADDVPSRHDTYWVNPDYWSKADKGKL